MRQSGSSAVEQVLAANLCSGCGLCAALTNSKMVAENPGFNRPRIDGPVDHDIDALIVETCPGSVVAPWPSAPNVHEFWGPYFELKAGHARDAALRHRASSGGALSAILIFVLEKKIVDAIVQIGPDPTHPTQNVTIISTTVEQVIEAAGSRYAPSSPLDGVDQLLASDRRHAFVGKPCDVSALRLLGRSDPRVAERFPLMFSFFCAGIPSLDRSDAILQKLGFMPDDIVSFRYRGNGWPGDAVAVGKDGAVRSMSYSESWGDALSKEIQFRCKICPDAVGGSADLVCADAWHSDEQGYPLFEDLPGRSLIIPRTGIGAGILDRAIESGAVEVEDGSLTPADMDSMQPGQTKKKRLVRSRTLAMKFLSRPVPTMRGLKVDEAARRSGVDERVRNFLGMIRRHLNGRF